LADPEVVKFVTLINGDEECLDVFHEDSPVRYRHMNQVIGDKPVPGQAVRVLASVQHGRPR
jgi:hypothetical protein